MNSAIAGEEGDRVVLINEILFDAVDDDDGKEWVELYNAGESAVDATGWQLANRTETIATLPKIEIPAQAYLLIRMGRAPDAAADKANVVHIGRAKAAFGNEYGELALYRGEISAESIEDFVAYSRDGHRDEGPGFGHAVAAGIWQRGAAVRHAEFVGPGDTLGRDSASEDTNTTDDWWRRGGLDALSPTPGARNTHPLAYELCALIRPDLFPAVFFDVSAAHQAKIDLLKKVLQQIRTKHMDLIEGLGDSLMGDGEPVQQENGDLLVGKIRFRFSANLTHPAHPDKSVGGLTRPPDATGEEVLILLNSTTLSSEWRMKDAVLHEIGHAAQFQDARTGYFKQNGRPEPDSTRLRALPTHECRCYLSNMRLLCRFKVTGEFSDHAHDIDDRLQFKAGHFMSFLKKGTEGLGRFSSNRADWAFFGTHLLAGLNGDRDMALKVLVVAFKLPTEEERKAGQAGQVTDFEKRLLTYIIRLWNSVNLPADKIPEAGLTRFVEQLLARDLNELIREVGTPPAAPDRTARVPRQPPPPVDDGTARAAAAAEAARIQAIKVEAERLKQRYYHFSRQKKAAADEVEKYEGYKRTVDRADPQAENGGTVEVHKRLEEAKRALAIATAETARTYAEYLAYRRAHRTELAYVPSNRDGRLARATVVTDPGAMLVTDLGEQAYANYERILTTGDVTQLEAFADTLVSNYDDESTDEEYLTATDIELVAALNDATMATVTDLRDFLTTTRKQLHDAGGNADMLADVLISLGNEPPEIDAVIASYIQSPEAFRMRVFDAFSADVMREVARQSQTEPGASVTKGNAVLDGPSSTSVVGATVKISLFSDEPDGDADTAPGNDLSVVETDENGQFEINGTGIATITISGEDLVTEKREVRVVEAPFGWSRHVWEELPAPDRLDVHRVRTVILWHALDAFSGGGAENNDTPPGERAERTLGLLQDRIDQWLIDPLPSAARRDLVIDELVGPLESPQVTSRLNEAFEEHPGDSFAKSVPGLYELLMKQSLEDQYVPNASAFPPVMATSKPESIAVELDGSPSDEAAKTLGERLAQAVKDASPDNSEFRMEMRDNRPLQFPESLGGDSTLQTWTVRITNEDGAPAHADKQKLQANLNELAADLPFVRFAEASRPSEAEAGPPVDPHYTSRGSWGEAYHDQWALRRIGIDGKGGEWPKALSAVDSGKPCIVAVIGSGVDWTHPELFGQMWVNPKEDPYNGIDDDGDGHVDDQFGFNFRDESGDVIDEGGHETHVAGIIAARWDDRGIAGVNPHARVMALKVANYLGQANSIDISRAIFYAVEHGARVINISYSGDKPTKIEQRAINYAHSQGVLVVVAAGNQAINAATRSPASVTQAITVAGLTVDNKRAPFSNWGQPVDIAAPAMDILGLRAQDTDFLMYVGENPDYTAGTGIVGKKRDLYRAGGTSFAAPFVSGAASLLFSTSPDLTAEQVTNMLLMSATDVDVPGWDQNSGAGLVNVVEALATAPDRYLLTRISSVTPKRRNGKVEIEVHGLATGTKVTGRWLQIAFGKDPKRTEWKTISHQRNAVAKEGVLGSIESSQFDRRGTWSIRVLVEDDKKNVRQARAVLNLE